MEVIVILKDIIALFESAEMQQLIQDAITVGGSSGSQTASLSAAVHQATPAAVRPAPAPAPVTATNPHLITPAHFAPAK